MWLFCQELGLAVWTREARFLLFHFHVLLDSGSRGGWLADQFRVRILFFLREGREQRAGTPLHLTFRTCEDTMLGPPAATL